VHAPGEPVFSVPGSLSADIPLVVQVISGRGREDADGMNATSAAASSGSRADKMTYNSTMATAIDVFHNVTRQKQQQQQQQHNQNLYTMLPITQTELLLLDQFYTVAAANGICTDSNNNAKFTTATTINNNGKDCTFDQTFYNPIIALRGLSRLLQNYNITTTTKTILMNKDDDEINHDNEISIRQQLIDLTIEA
jgi:hypothetical protein